MLQRWLKRDSGLRRLVLTDRDSAVLFQVAKEFPNVPDVVRLNSLALVTRMLLSFREVQEHLAQNAAVREFVFERGGSITEIRPMEGDLQGIALVMPRRLAASLALGCDVVVGQLKEYELRRRTGCSVADVDALVDRIKIATERRQAPG